MVLGFEADPSGLVGEVDVVDDWVGLVEVTGGVLGGGVDGGGVVTLGATATFTLIFEVRA